MVGFGLGEIIRGGGGAAAAAVAVAATAAPKIPSYPSSFKHAPSLSLGVQEAWIEIIFKNDASRDAQFVRCCFGTLQSFWERLEKSVSPAEPPLSDTKALGVWLETSSVRECFMLHFGKLDKTAKKRLRPGMVGFGLGEIIAAAAAAERSKRYREKKKQKLKQEEDEEEEEEEEEEEQQQQG